MTLYFVSRVALAIALLWLLRAELPRELRRCALFVALTLPVNPEWLSNYKYGIYIWTPLRFVLWILAIRVSAELFRLATHRATFWWERVNLAAFIAAVLSLLLVVMIRAGLTLQPENQLQVFAIANQYFWLSLCVVIGVACGLYGFLTPIPLTGPTKALCGFWGVFCACMFVGSTAGGGCFLFQFIPSKGNGPIYRMFGIVPMWIIAVSAVWCRRRIESSPTYTS